MTAIALKNFIKRAGDAADVPILTVHWQHGYKFVLLINRYALTSFVQLSGLHHDLVNALQKHDAVYAVIKATQLMPK